MSILYPIIESEHGPLISDSQVTVYNVMELHNEGLSRYEICKTYNLLPIQLESALEYMAQNGADAPPLPSDESGLKSQEKNGHLKNNGHLNGYTVIESKIGPVISESRTTIYDVMQVYDEGLSFYDICRTYNLTPHQLETALEYIQAHRQTLEAKLAQILIKKAEYERYHRAIEAEARKKIAQLPMTPERAKFYAKREESRRRWVAEGKIEASDRAHNAWLQENRRRAAERKANAMDTRMNYPEIVKKILTEIADSYSQSNEWPIRALFDDERQSYLLLDNGWNGNKYVHHTPIHIDVIDDKVWIQYDDSEEGVATDLLEAGISKSAIVLGFRPPKVRPYTEFVTG